MKQLAEIKHRKSGPTVLGDQQTFSKYREDIGGYHISYHNHWWDIVQRDSSATFLGKQITELLELICDSTLLLGDETSNFHTDWTYTYKLSNIILFYLYSNRRTVNTAGTAFMGQNESEFRKTNYIHCNGKLQPVKRKTTKYCK